MKKHSRTTQIQPNHHYKMENDAAFLLTLRFLITICFFNIISFFAFLADGEQTSQIIDFSHLHSLLDIKIHFDKMRI